MEGRREGGRVKRREGGMEDKKNSEGWREERREREG